ncbi:hypothetical protein FAIPA1_90012 [Frankia sp. AiPs1]
MAVLATVRALAGVAGLLVWRGGWRVMGGYRRT